MRKDFALVYRDKSRSPAWVDKETAMEWAEKKEGDGGTIKVSEGSRVDVNQFIAVESREVFSNRGAVITPVRRNPVVKLLEDVHGYKYEEVQRNPDGSVMYEKSP